MRNHPPGPVIVQSGATTSPGPGDTSDASLAHERTSPPDEYLAPANEPAPSAPTSAAAANPALAKPAPAAPAQPTPAVLDTVVAEALTTLATDYNIKISTGRFLSYPMYVSFRIYTDEQREHIRRLLEYIRIADTQRLARVQNSDEPASVTARRQIKLDLRHVERIIGWMNSFEQRRAEDKKA